MLVMGKKTIQAIIKPTATVSTEEQSTPQPKPPPAVSYQSRRGRDNNSQPRCFVCGKIGHLSYDCREGKRNPGGTGLLCMTPLDSEREAELQPHYISGCISGKTVLKHVGGLGLHKNTDSPEICFRCQKDRRVHFCTYS